MLRTVISTKWSNINPYEVVKFFYEYFKDEISQNDEVLFQICTPGFKKLEIRQHMKCKKNIGRNTENFISRSRAWQNLYGSYAR